MSFKASVTSTREQVVHKAKRRLILYIIKKYLLTKAQLYNNVDVVSRFKCFSAAHWQQRWTEGGTNVGIINMFSNRNKARNMISNNVSFPIIKNIVAKVSVTLEQNVSNVFFSSFFRKLQICVFIFYQCEICFQEVVFTVHFYKKKN